MRNKSLLPTQVLMVILVLEFNPTLSCRAEETTDKSSTSAAVRTPAEENTQDNTKIVTRPRIALSLSGGGARGLAHIGVLKVLDDNGIRPDLIVGTSMGALIGGLSAAGMTPREIEKLAYSGELRHAFFPRAIGVQASFVLPQYATMRLLRLKPAMGLYSGKSIASFMRKHLPADIRNIEQTKIPFAAACTSLNDGKTVWKQKGDIAAAVRASNSVPFFYKPVRESDTYLIDGGIITNLPTELATAKGATIILAVRLHNDLAKLTRASFDSELEYADRVSSILLGSSERRTMDEADVLIAPVTKHIEFTAMDAEHAKLAIAAGEEATKLALPQILKAIRGEKLAGSSGNLPH